MPREGWWHSRTGQTGPNTSLWDHPLLCWGRMRSRWIQALPRALGSSQVRRTIQEQDPGLVMLEPPAEGCSSGSWNVLNGDGPTGVIKSNPGPADIPKSHPALEGVVQTLLELWEPFPGADPFPSWRGGISLSLPVPAPFSLWHNKIRPITGNSTPV